MAPPPILLGDSSTPLGQPSGWQYPKWFGSPASPISGWGFYIGGDTPHVWTDAEIAALPYRYRLPIFTRSNPNGAVGAGVDSADIIRWAQEHRQPKGTLIQIDLETAVDPAYVSTLSTGVAGAGWKIIAYGSAAYVTGNPAPAGGYNVATWTGRAPTTQETMGEQFADIGPYDLNSFLPYAPLWDTLGGTSMLPMIYRVTGDATVWMLHPAGLMWAISDPVALQSYINQGYPQIQVDPGEIARIQAEIAASRTITMGLDGTLAGTITPPAAPGA